MNKKTLIDILEEKKNYQSNADKPLFVRLSMNIQCHNTQNMTYPKYMNDYRIKESEKQNISILTTDPLRNKVADQVYIEG